MIEFILNKKIVRTNAHHSMTLVDFIREDRLLKGTKIVCREGDCGACTVLVGEYTQRENGSKYVKYHTITSCISPLANAHGKHIVTVEGLNMNDKLTQVQQSLKDHYASQCGFCTPGFVMAMTQYCLNAQANNEQHMLDAISGNICRCTGYVSIINAAKNIVASCQDKDHKFTMSQLVEHHFVPDYFLDVLEQLQNINDKGVSKNFSSMGERLIAGGTDLFVQQADRLIEQKNLRYVMHEQDQNLQVNDQKCSISGAATVTDLFDHMQLNQSMPLLKKYLRVVSSEAIRNMATIAGNFVNASPIADMSVFFLALNTQLVLEDNEMSRQVALKDFFLSYKNTDLNANESIVQINCELPNKKAKFHFEKVSKRKHLDIATVNTAIHIECDEDAVITHIALSIGGVAPIPLFLHKTCDFLLGQELTSSVVNKAIDVVNSEIAPISDVRGSAQYKRLLANQLIKGHFIELFPEHITFDQLNIHSGVMS